jgi:hypothetical protein
MAVTLVHLSDVVENCKYIMGEVLLLESAVAALTAAELLNPGWAVLTLTQDEINDQLKKLTGCVVATGTDLNCYPTGLNTAILFDADGNPVD